MDEPTYVTVSRVYSQIDTTRFPKIQDIIEVERSNMGYNFICFRNQRWEDWNAEDRHMVHKLTKFRQNYWAVIPEMTYEEHSKWTNTTVEEINASEAMQSRLREILSEELHLLGG